MVLLQEAVLLFNSYPFLFAFFPVTFAGFFLLGKASSRAAVIWLAAASLFFYGWWSPKAVPLLLLSVGVNYGFGSLLSSPRARRWQLWCAVLFNLSLLGFFKYANFFLENVNGALGRAGGSPLEIALPIGISFYTFTQVAFVVDCWAGKVRERRISHYLLFVTYFPHLIAGPVLHHSQMMPQFARPGTFRMDARKIATGLAIFVVGLAKKHLLADWVGAYATSIFDAVAAGVAPKLLLAWFGTLAYTFQIYFDFSGYSDMAVGISLFFGITLPLNFAAPYRATSMVDFWRRWHISLSTFLRDYLYIPLGGNRHGTGRRYWNLFVTMLLGGLWHGASWTFVLWGGAHGALLTVNHAWNKVGRVVFAPLAWAVTFVCVCFTWVLFRSGTALNALAMLRGLAGLNGVALPGNGKGPWQGVSPPAEGSTLELLLLIVFCFAAVLVPPPFAQEALSEDPRGVFRRVNLGIPLAMLFTICLLSLSRKTTFLYFQF